MALNTLFVSNFPFATTEDDLRSLFGEICSVSSVRIITDRTTGRSRGFAFIEATDETRVEQAIERLNESDFRGRRLVVNRAKGRGPSPEKPRSPSRPAAGGEPFRCRIVVEWSDDDREYVAEIPELGLRARGDTIERAVREATTLGVRAAPDKSQAAGA